MSMKKLLALLLVATQLAPAALAAGPTQKLPGDTIQIGKVGNTAKTVEAMVSGTSSTNPKLKWDTSTSKWTFSNDGTNFKSMGSGSGGSGVNYLTNGDFEAQLTDWSYFNERFDVATSAIDTSAETITKTAHGLQNGDRIQLSSSGGVPGGLAGLATYYVTGVTANTFQLAATRGGVAIDLTSQGTGTHTFYPLQLVDGTGSGNGYSNASNWTASTSSPLSGTYSLVYAHAAANEGGAGRSADFTIDSKDQGKALAVSFDYTLVSGTYDSSTAAPGLTDVTFYLYDKTNALRIDPSSFRVENVAAGTNARVYVTFPTAYNSTSYRFGIMASATSATAYTIKFDNFSVGPQTSVQAPTVSAWQNCGGGLSNSANETMTVYCRRVGDSAQFMGHVSWGGASSGGSATTYNLPSGLVIDTAKMNAVAQSNVLGNGQWLDLGTARKDVNVLYATTTTVSFERSDASGPLIGTGFASGDNLDFIFTAPIVGWSGSGTLFGSDVPSRTIVWKGSVSTTISTLQVVPFGNDKDPSGIYNSGSSTVTAPVQGDYDVKCNTDIGGSSGNVGRTWIYKNGSAEVLLMGGIVPAGGNSVIISGAYTLSMNAGDTMSIRHSNSISTSTSMFCSLKLSPGNTTLQAGDTYTAHYYTASGQAVTTGNTTIIDFGSKYWDSNGMCTTGASFKCCAPIAGTWNVNSMFIFGGTGTAGYLSAKLYVDGVYEARGKTELPVNASEQSVSINYDVKLKAGQCVDVRGVNATGSNRTLSTSTGENYFMFKRIGDYK